MKNSSCWLKTGRLSKSANMFIRGFTKFGIKVAWRLQFLEYLRTLSLKFQKATSKIEVLLALPCWLSQFSRARTTSILLVAFWNFKLMVLKYPRNCRLHNTLTPWSLKNPESPNVYASFHSCASQSKGHTWNTNISPV